MTDHNWATADMEARIAAHVDAWQHAKQLSLPRPAETLPFVTINREFGCEGLHIATQLAVLLNERSHPAIPWVTYDRELIDRVSQELHLRREVVESLDGKRRGEMTELFDTLLNRRVTEAEILRKQAEVVSSLAIHGHSVIVGRGSHLLTKDLKTGLHVCLVAPREWRVSRVAETRDTSVAKAERIVVEGEKERRQFLDAYFNYDSGNPFRYDLTIDIAKFTPAEVVEIISAAVLTTRFEGSGRSLTGSKN